MNYNKSNFYIPLIFVILALTTYISHYLYPETINLNQLISWKVTGPDTADLVKLVGRYQKELEAGFFIKLKKFSDNNFESVPYGIVNYFFKFESPLSYILVTNLILVLLSYWLTCKILGQNNIRKTRILIYFIYLNPVLFTSFFSLNKDLYLMIVLQLLILGLRSQLRYFLYVFFGFLIYVIRHRYIIFMASLVTPLLFQRYIDKYFSNNKRKVGAVFLGYTFFSLICFYFSMKHQEIILNGSTCEINWGAKSLAYNICDFFQFYWFTANGTTTQIYYSENFPLFFIQLITNSIFSPIFSVSIDYFLSLQKSFFLFLCLAHRSFYLFFLYRLFRNNPKWAITSLFFFLEMMTYFITRNYGTAIRVMFPWNCFLLLYLAQDNLKIKVSESLEA